MTIKNPAYLLADNANGVIVYPTEGELKDQNGITGPVPYLAPGDFYAILPALGENERVFAFFDLEDPEDGPLYEQIRDEYGLSGCIFTVRYCRHCQGVRYFWGMDDQGVRRCTDCNEAF